MSPAPISDRGTGVGGLHCELPAGLGDILPDHAAEFLELRRELLQTMARWGYRPVVPPLLEYAEVFSRAAADPGTELAAYKLVDRDTGHVLALRPDFTPQLARLVATRFRDASLPLRLCYEGSVLRHVPARTGRSRELHQVGAELLGVCDPEADAEAIALAVDCLHRAGLREFKVDVGQVEFFRGVLQGTALTADQTDTVTSAVARKDVSELATVLELLPLSDSKKRLLAELPLLAGGPEVLDRALAMVESDHSRAALDGLTQVVRYAEAHHLADHLTIDLGEIRGIDYHTGVIFEAFVHHLGVPLCRGGRYDRLLGCYGVDLPATGFSLDLVALTEALHLQHGAGPTAPRGVFLVNFAPNRTPAVALAHSLRDAGVRAARDCIRRPLEQSAAHAREQGFRWVAVLTEQGTAAPLRLLDLTTGGEHPVAHDQLVATLTAEES